MHLHLLQPDFKLEQRLKSFFPQQPATDSSSNQDVFDFVNQGFARINEGFGRMDEGFARMDVDFARMDLNYGYTREEFEYIRQDVIGLTSRIDQYHAFRMREKLDDMNHD